jgi:hypothetical protein
MCRLLKGVELGERSRWLLQAAAFLVPLVISGQAVLTAGTIKGTGRYETIKGHPGNYIELYEWNLFLSQDAGTALGERRRLGACSEYGSACTAGYYQIDNRSGWNTIYVSQPIFYARPTLVTDVQIGDSQVVTVNPELNIDYSCRNVADGAWSWSTVWYQTFVATGTSINRIQFMLAGWNASSIAVSVLHDNGGAITTWPQVGPTKSAGVGYGDGWVGFRSGDIPTTPYQRYAVRLTGQGGTSPSDFAVRCRTEDGNGYALGQAYDAGGNPRNLDLLVTVFSDNDGTVIPYIDMTPGNVEDLAGGTGAWGQTFKATAAALAATDCFIAGAGTWDVDVTFRVRQNGPTGAQVGPTKIAQAVYQATNCGLVGVSYAPGEVPLVPGNTYFIEMSPAAGSPTFAAYKFHSQSDNGYPYGSAYKDGVLQPDVDLEMTIMEYKPWYSPAVVNPGFEDYGGKLDGWRVTAASGVGPDNPPLDNSNPYGPKTTFGDHFAGKITNWGSMSFTLGQMIEVANYSPTSDHIAWVLNAYVQLHGHTGQTDEPQNVHQVWEIGWNADGSMPASVDRCTNYATVASLDGAFTNNDRLAFHPLSLSGMLSGATGLKGMAVRVRMYNDAVREWSMSNVDNVSFTATVPPPGPEIALSTDAIERTVAICDVPPMDTFTVANAGPAMMNYTISDDAAWLSVAPTAGSSAGEPDLIQVTYAWAGLPIGTYFATITLSSAEAWNSPRTIPVSLTVRTVRPDLDGDSDVDQKDVGLLQACYTGPGVAQQDPACQAARLDGDEDADTDDFAVLQRCLSGPDVCPPSGCDDQ